MQTSYLHSLCCCCITRVLLLLLFCFIPSLFSTPPHPHPHPHPLLNNASDQHALLRFISAITYNPSQQQLATNWTPHVSFCHWTGILCSRRRERVVSLNVSSMGLQEYGLSGRVTTKGDVYSYGIVLLEMVTGKKPTNNMFVEGMNLPKWVGSALPNQIVEVVDMSLLRIMSSTSIEEDKDFNCLRELITLGLLCTHESLEGRPTMIDIVSALQHMRKTFLRVVDIPKFQSDITHLLASSSTITTTLLKPKVHPHPNLSLRE